MLASYFATHGLQGWGSAPLPSLGGSFFLSLSAPLSLSLFPLSSARGSAAAAAAVAPTQTRSRWGPVTYREAGPTGAVGSAAIASAGFSWVWVGLGRGVRFVPCRSTHASGTNFVSMFPPSVSKREHPLRSSLTIPLFKCRPLGSFKTRDEL